jgi:hypothetical protein
MDVAIRGWEPIRDARKRRQIAHNNVRCQEVTEDNVLAIKYQDCRRNEESSRKIKSGVGIKDRMKGLVGAPTGKGKIFGHGNRHSESMPQTYRLGGG